MTTIIEVLGWMTAILTILLYLPLVVKTLKTKNTEGISKSTFLIVLMAGILFVIWGGSMNITPTIVANFAIGVLMIPMLFLLLKSKITAMLISIVTIALMVGGVLLHEGLLDINIDKDWTHTESAFQLTTVIFASIFLAFSWGPQLFIVIKDKTHSTKNLSFIGLLLGTIANALWIAYFSLELTQIDYLDGDPGVIVAIVSTVVMFSMLFTLTCFKTHNMVKNID